jgi:predicted Zn-dependent protease
MIDGIVYGEDPRQGYVEGNTFYHPEMRFKFSFPVGWALENSPVQVRMAPKDGKALMIFTLSPQKTLEEAASVTIEQLGLTMVENRKTTVNGSRAIVTLSRQVPKDQSTGQQSTIMVLSYFIEYNNAFYVFHGLSAEADFGTYSKVMETAIMNFSKLTDPSKLNVKPKKILVKTVQRAGTFDEVLKSFGVTQQEMSEVALLNNTELKNKVQAGKMIKIIAK